VDRWGVTSWAPIVHLETATAIAAGGSVEDGPVARKLARTSLAEAGALGIARVHERAGQLVSQLS
jgi:hypothetical protein